MRALNPANMDGMSGEILTVIRQYLSNYVSTAFIAEVTNVYAENGSARVDVKEVNAFETSDGVTVRRSALNLMVGSLGSKGWTLSYPVHVGDIGLCITSKHDLSSFMETGAAGLTMGNRNFNIADSIYIPLSLFFQPEITENIELKSEKTTITLTPDGDITVEAQGKVAVKCNDVELGGEALEKMIKGETFMQFFNSHVHTGNLGAPTSPPQQPMTEAQLSNEVKNS
mgnify:CR=1 FL=1